MHVAGHPFAVQTGAANAPGAVNFGNTRVDGAITLTKAVTATGIFTARAAVNGEWMQPRSWAHPLLGRCRPLP